MSTTITREITQLVEMLPQNEQNLAYELVKRMVLAWDSDFTKLTPAERMLLEEAENDFANGNAVNYKDVDWS